MSKQFCSKCKQDITCIKCKGSGIIIDPTPTLGPFNEITCPKCGGTRKDNTHRCSGQNTYGKPTKVITTKTVTRVYKE